MISSLWPMLRKKTGSERWRSQRRARNIFGPDVVLNVDKMGMTLSEAFDLLKTEITVQK